MDFLVQDNCILQLQFHTLVLVEVVRLLSNGILVQEWVMGMLELSYWRDIDMQVSWESRKVDMQ